MGILSGFSDESNDDYYYRYKQVENDVDIITTDLKNKTNELNILKNLVKEYLKLGYYECMIGRNLRRNLAAHIGEKWDENNQRIKEK
jgi:hypothetical protein